MVQRQNIISKQQHIDEQTWRQHWPARTSIKRRVPWTIRRWVGVRKCRSCVLLVPPYWMIYRFHTVHTSPNGVSVWFGMCRAHCSWNKGKRATAATSGPSTTLVSIKPCWAVAKHRRWTMQLFSDEKKSWQKSHVFWRLCVSDTSQANGRNHAVINDDGFCGSGVNPQSRGRYVVFFPVPKPTNPSWRLVFCWKPFLVIEEVYPSGSQLPLYI